MNDRTYSLAGKRVWVAGHRGMVGGALVHRLQREDCEILMASHAELDLRDQAAVKRWMASTKPQAVFMAAATVGGILANSTRPAEFLYDNLMIATNVIHASYQLGVEKLLFLGSSCIYPRMAPQPMTEDMLLTGPLEPTNAPYALAKIAGIKMCDAYRTQYGCDFISAMPTNLFGPGDRYDLQQGHVVAALIMKIHRAKQEGAAVVELWGSGTPLREFLYSEDLADGLIFMMKNYSAEGHLNIGTGTEMSILDLAMAIAEAIGWSGKFRCDTSKPDGSPRKLMDVSRLTELGWTAQTSLSDGMRAAYAWFLANSPHAHA